MLSNNFSTIVGARRLRLKAIASATGLSRTTLTALYYDKVNGISFNTLEKLCGYLNCSPNDIFEFHESEVDVDDETEAEPKQNTA